MGYFRLVLLTILVIYVVGVQNANILAVLPLVQKSHFVMYRKLLEELAIRGHSVDIVGIPAPPGPKISGLSYKDLPDVPKPNLPEFTIQDLRKFNVSFALEFMFSVDSSQICTGVFNDNVMRNLMNSKKKYDLLFLEIFIGECFFGLAHVFKVPVVSLISSTDLPWGSYRIGNPDNPAYIPIYFQGYRPHVSLYERFWNTMTYIQCKVGHWWYIKTQNQMAKEFFGQDMPDLNDIVANISLLLVNSHFSLNIARPTVPNFIEVGGLHIGSPKPLDKKIDHFIGNDKFIYFSLGSLAKSETLEPNILKHFMTAFSEMNYKVLWKANGTVISSKVRIPSNVLVQEWMPQLDVLCHPNIVLFITHSGLMGTQEAIHCEVPMLCLPLFADQYQNCQNLIDKGVAKSFILEKASKEEFRSMVLELIENPSYKSNVKKLSHQFKDRPMSPLDTAIYWVEYVLRHKGAPQMKSMAVSLKWYQYHLFDVISVLLSLFAFVLVCAYISIKIVFRKSKSDALSIDGSDRKNK